MNWSKAMAVGYVASIVLGAVIGGSFAPAWSGYVALTGLALLPIIIFLKPKAVRSMSRHHFAEKLKMAFGGISSWLWGVVAVSVLGSVTLAVTDTIESGMHELVTPILQSIVAAFVFYVVDVAYPRNINRRNTKEKTNKIAQTLRHRWKIVNTKLLGQSKNDTEKKTSLKAIDWGGEIPLIDGKKATYAEFIFETAKDSKSKISDILSAYANHLDQTILEKIYEIKGSAFISLANEHAKARLPDESGKDDLVRFMFLAFKNYSKLCDELEILTRDTTKQSQ